LSLSITAASGIAIYRDDGEDIETLLRQSDKAMYKNKLSKDAQ
ncbi:MAG TPA: diguanylate cyclase, partial [Methylophaga aminisulfidivorans]|nr:diguanylate cyclase [Methylophaga aminisulfidivorans]